MRTNYFLVSSQEEGLASQEIRRLCQAFLEMSIPLAEDKMVGPVKKVIYLDKYNELMLLLPKWLQKRSCQKQQLLSLIGKLSFICIVVRPGRMFLQRLIDLSMSVEKLSHHINVNKEAQLDIIWW